MTSADLGVIALIWALASLDGAFTGYRDATGRDPRIRKRPFFLAALGRGFLAAQLVVLLACLWLGGSLLLSEPLAGAAPGELWAAYLRAGAFLGQVYLAPISLTLAALLIFLNAPALDLRVLATVVVLGPLTVLRPLVIWLGPLWVSFQDLPAAVVVFTWGAAAGILAIGPLIGRRWPRRPRIE